MRVLVIGGSGLVGAHVLAEAHARGHTTLGTYRTHPVQGLEALDLADASATATLLDQWHPDAVVHAAGWTWVDGCESDPARAMRENAEQPAMLAALCAQRGIRIAYCSSSYVFDGNAGPYRETNQAHPINMYGRSKLAGEQSVQAAAGSLALICRLICVWGHEPQRKNFVYQVLRAIEQNQPMRIPSDQCGNPTWAGDVAAWLFELLETGTSGVWHLAGPHPEWTRIQWAGAITEGLRTVHPELTPAINHWSTTACPTAELRQPALRPLQAGMSCEKIQSLAPRHLREPQALDVILR